MQFKASSSFFFQSSSVFVLNPRTVECALDPYKKFLLNPSPSGRFQLPNRVIFKRMFSSSSFSGVQWPTQHTNTQVDETPWPAWLGVRPKSTNWPRKNLLLNGIRIWGWCVYQGQKILLLHFTLTIFGLDTTLIEVQLKFPHWHLRDGWRPTPTWSSSFYCYF